MNLDLKFTGNFKKLKAMGYEFQKLYARNYKVYHKQIPRSFRIWIWVANGGYIEIDDLYSNTKSFVETVKSINWNEIKPIVGFTSNEPYKRVYIRFSHEHPERGCQVADHHFDLEVIMSFPEEKRKDYYKDKEAYDAAYNKVREYYDREIVVMENSAKELLAELERISK